MSHRYRERWRARGGSRQYRERKRAPFLNGNSNMPMIDCAPFSTGSTYEEVFALLDGSHLAQTERSACGKVPACIDHSFNRHSVCGLPASSAEQGRVEAQRKTSAKGGPGL